MYMKNKRPIVINLISGPCAGKSTTATGIFYELKKRGIECEMALEFAKDKVWEESFKTMDDQIYIFGKQYHKLWRLKDKVDVIITDSPLIISLYYNKDESVYFNDFVVEQYNRFDNRMYFIERNADYQENGRMQTKEEAEAIDRDIKNILDKYNIDHCCVENKYAVRRIVMDVLRELNHHSCSCIIDKYSDNMREKLIDMGYQFIDRIDYESADEIGIFTDASKNMAYTCILSEMTELIQTKLLSDAQSDEVLFLALAALSDGHDKDQWFVLDTNLASAFDIDNITPKRSFIMCSNWHWNVDMRPDYSCLAVSSRNIPAHKASVVELYDHFYYSKRDKTN